MKENRQPILSICIPTWNRWYALQYTLKSIIEQEEFKSWDIEVVISDNSSTDETENEVKKLCKVYRNIRYSRNEKNIGWNPNINKSLSLWKWEYLWLLWSDDKILSWWLKYTLKAIHENEPDLILHKQSLCPTCKGLYAKCYDDKQWKFIFKSQKEYFNYLWDWYNFDVNSFWHIEHLQTFMSLICIKKSYYKKCLSAIMKDKIRNDKITTFYFSQSLLSHFCEIDSAIILSDKCYISSVSTEWNLNNIRQSWYKYTRAIAVDARLLYNFYDNKYSLNDNFRILGKRSYQYRNWCIVYGFLEKLLWKRITSFLSKIYHKIFI